MTNTKQILSEIGKDVSKVTLEGLLQVGSKLSYPILGNLSEGLQSGIEERLGKKYYNTVHATRLSLATNTLTYSYLFYELSIATSQDPYMGIIYGSAFGAMELMVRSLFSYVSLESQDSSDYYLLHHDFPSLPNSPVASLVGKTVSLPFEGVNYAYNVFRRYLKGINERIKKRNELGECK
ncbi:MAG: hypothetical protein WCV90_08705 [Candidatus Woesearchaeota archaeon]